MIEIRGDKKVLITPISAEDLADIKIGDIVWLDGDLMTCRDVAHRRLVEYGRELPYDIRNKAIFHAGPIVRKIEGTEDDYEMVSVGPTTSMRMEKFEYEFTKLTGVRVIVGKGGMGPNTERACKEFGAIHCVFPAGCAVVAATEVEKKLFLVQVRGGSQAQTRLVVQSSQRGWLSFFQFRCRFRVRALDQDIELFQQQEYKRFRRVF